jgi:hypothetical protein
MRTPCYLMAAVLLSSCVTTEIVQFQPKAEQQALVRDGRNALVSRQKNSIVLIRTAPREIKPGARPVFVVGMYNLSKSPLEFRIANIEATQVVNQAAAPLKVITYEQLVNEEHDRQVFAAVGAGLAAAGNSMAAANAGYYRSNTTISGPGGIYQAQTVGYNPAAGAIAQANASAQNEAMISATIERGQANLAGLENSVVKDNTLLPGEWYGGQLFLQPLIPDGAKKKVYQIVLLVGSDRHEIDVVQGSTQ